MISRRQRLARLCFVVLSLVIVGADILASLCSLQAKLVLQAAQDGEEVMRSLCAVTGPALFNSTSPRGTEVRLILFIPLFRNSNLIRHAKLTLHILNWPCNAFTVLITSFQSMAEVLPVLIGELTYEFLL